MRKQQLRMASGGAVARVNCAIVGSAVVGEDALSTELNSRASLMATNG